MTEWSGESGTAGACPYCPGGIDAPDPYDVSWVLDRTPALDRDRCEILIYSSDHNATLAGMGADAVRRVVDLWADRTSALGARPDVAYVLVFENHGPEAGATTAHPHGHAYAFSTVPPVPTAELAAYPCRVCLEDPQGRLVAQDMSWRAWVPALAAWPYSLVLASVNHGTDLPSLPGWERDALARLLVDVLGRLDHLFGAPMPYLLWIHQGPTDGAAWSNAHLHVEISGLYRAAGTFRYVSAAEHGSGVLFNPVPPERAAAELREASPPPSGEG